MRYVTGFSGTNVRLLGQKNTHVPKTDPNDVSDSQQDVQREKTHAGHDEQSGHDHVSVQAYS